MTILTRSLFQAHPFHLVSPSPWPFNTSSSLLALPLSAVLIFQGFTNAVDVITMGLLSVVLSMSLWFRDVISEGKSLNYTKIFITLIILFTFLFIVLYPTYIEINSKY
jgi:cytochrome c oxidase subunit 3